MGTIKLTKCEKYIFTIIALCAIMALGCWGLYNTDFSEKLNEPLKGTKEWFEWRIKKRIESELQNGEKYVPIEWNGITRKNSNGEIIFGEGKISSEVLSSDWAFISFKHTFKVINKEGCESHYEKLISFDKEGNIIRYENNVELPEDYIGFGGYDKFYGFRTAKDKELILWSEDLIRKYISMNLEDSQKYVPKEWAQFTKATLNVAGDLSLEHLVFSDKCSGNTDWAAAALYVIHKYYIEGPKDEVLKAERVFFINPEGKLKVIPLNQLPQQTDKGFILTLFTDYD